MAKPALWRVFIPTIIKFNHH